MPGCLALLRHVNMPFVVVKTGYVPVLTAVADLKRMHKSLEAGGMQADSSAATGMIACNFIEAHANGPLRWYLDSGS